MDFEKKIDKLQEIVQCLEKGDLSLEDSLKSFEEGIKLARECQSKLNEAEVTVKKLVSIDEKGLPQTENFAVEEA